MEVIRHAAQNFSRRVQQPVKVFHDGFREKYRMCPVPAGNNANLDSYGLCCFDCDMSDPKFPESRPNTAPSNISDGGGIRIPRPRNSWILYRQHKSNQLKKDFPGMTASELSTVISSLWKSESTTEKAIWQRRAREEDRLHKEKYPGYKYTAKRSSSKRKQSEISRN
ncbi:MAT1-1-3 [Drechmeria coniospora]|uniref:MAT1-1-3 n=1 Tax=Drechmeria coniospora TaxID=98403 RepID=A0A151GRN1_DRECN|nr:MAT1-1-3 [Drechmeria coniospora]KYK59756.1 MAT1-1-3 [Drechmeria coniospora]